MSDRTSIANFKIVDELKSSLKTKVLSPILIRVSLKETVFETTTPLAEIDDQQGQDFLAHRWKFVAELEKQIQVSVFEKSKISIQGIAGPQPLPIHFLPRSWDYVHRLYPTPELGAMFGSGLKFTGDISKNFSIESHFGFYGGYVGGNLSARWKSMMLTASSWGIETSSAYHVLGQRFWHASLGFSF